MFGFNYLKAGPTQHIIHYRNGRIQQSGPGLSFFYYQPAEPRLMITMALKEIAQNAAKIGQLNISPNLLESLMQRS